MNKRMYAVKDRTAEIYMLPFHAPNDGVARRIFETAKTEDSTMKLYESDFECYYIGLYNDKDGYFQNEEPYRVDNKEE